MQHTTRDAAAGRTRLLTAVFTHSSIMNGSQWDVAKPNGSSFNIPCDFLWFRQEIWPFLQEFFLYLGSVNRGSWRHAVLYGCETWYFTWREQRRSTMLQKMVLKTAKGPARKAVKGDCRKLQMRCFMACTAHQGWAGHVARREAWEKHTAFWWGNLKERNSWKT